MTTRVSLLRLRVGVGRLDPDGLAVLGEDPVSAGIGQQLRSGVGCVLEIGAHGALFGAGLIAHAAVADQVRVVFLRVDVEHGDSIRVPELGRALLQPLVRVVLRGHLVVAVDAVEHRLQVFVERRGVDVGEAVFRPAGADGGRGQQRIGPVDGAAAAHGAPRGDVDHAVCGGEEPAAQEEVLIGQRFHLDEVGLIEVAARFQDDHPLAGLRQHGGGDPAAAAGADHNHIRLQRRLAGRR